MEQAPHFGAIPSTGDVQKKKAQQITDAEWREQFVEELCQPDAVRWCDGSEAEYAGMLEQLVASGTAEPLDPQKRPDSYLVRSDPADVKYLIKWKGWPAKYNTWEPMAHLQNLQQEIEAFESGRR